MKGSMSGDARVWSL